MLFRIMGRKQLRWRAGLAADRRLAASRHPSTAASRAAGLNGFCRLETAPSLVAMVRKSGASPGSEDDRPPGDHDDRDQRPQLMNHPHGLKPVHSRHEDVEEQQIEILASNNPSPFRPSPAVTTLWPARSSNSRMVACTALSSSTISIFAKSRFSGSRGESASTAGCEVCRKALATASCMRFRRA